MKRHAPLLTVLALTVLLVPHLPTELLPAAQAQPGQANLEVVSIHADNPVYDAEDPANLTATVKNHGPGTASGILHFRYNTTNRTVTGDSRSDQPFNTTDPLPPGASVTIQIPWSPSRDQIGPGRLIAAVTSTQDGTPENNQANATVFVEHYALNLTLLDEGDQTTLPGRTTGYRFLVVNTGNTPLTPEVDTVQEPGQGWRFDAWAQATKLAPGGNVTAIALVQPPDRDEDALPDGTNASARALAWSTENPRANATVRLPNTTVDREPAEPYTYGVELNSSVPEKAVNPQAPATLALKVINTGNLADVFNVTAAATGPLAANLTLEVRDPTVAIPAGGSTTVAVELAVSGDPPTDAHANLTVTAATINPRIETGVRATAWTDVHLAAPDLLPADLSVPKPVYQDAGRLPITVGVHNTGEGPAPATNVTAVATRGGFPFSTATATAPLLAAGTTANVTVSLPIANLSGAYTIEVTLDQDDLVDESRETNNGATADLFVRTGELVVRAAQGLEATPGQFIRYERPPNAFTVRNQGNADELVEVTIDSDHGWISDRFTLAIPSGGTRPVPFSLLVPTTPGTQEDRIEVHAHLINRTSVTSANTTATRVVDEQAPIPVTVDIPETVTASTAFNVSVTWQDAIGVDRSWLEITAPSNSTTVVNLTRQTNTTFTGNVTVYELGTHEVRLAAVDASQAANRFVQDTPLRVDADYDRTPEIVFLHVPEARTIRAGTGISVDVVDQAGLAQVRYEAAGTSGMLSAPFSIPTDGWSHGQHTVTVTAKNRYGLEAEETATYRVDNQAPEIADVRLEPSDPAPGQGFRVLVDVAGGSTGGTLEARDSQGVTLSTANLTRTGQDRLAAQMVLQEGDHELIVNVTDRAGNRAQETVALAVGQSLIPGPGAAHGLLILVIAAVGARWRRRSNGT